MDVNLLLEELAEEERQRRIDEQYEEFMEEMYQLWELEQYAADSYDEDAIYYGEV